MAGFSSHKFIAWLDRLADKIFSTTLPEKAFEKREAVKETASFDRTTLKETIHEEIVSDSGVDSPAKSDKMPPQNAPTGFETIKLETNPDIGSIKTKKPVAMKAIR